MSWLGGSISSLTGQLSNLTKDILTEGTEEIEDPTTELRLAKEKIEHLNAALSTQRQENERLKRFNRELEEKAESSELQINTISREYRGVLESKEKEVNALKHQHQELLEQQARTAALLVPSRDREASLSTASGSHSHESNQNWTSPGQGGENFASFNYEGDHGDWDFDDSIRLQRENNSLRAELQKLQSEAKHWRSVAGQLGQNAEQSGEQQWPGADVIDLEHKVKNLEAQLIKKGEEIQLQATSLQEHHRQKVASLKSSHKDEVDSLESRYKAEIEALHKQVSAWEESSHAKDGNSDAQNNGSYPQSVNDQLSQRELELQARLTESLSEKEKAQNACRNLEGLLEDLQQKGEHQHKPGDEDLQRKVAELAHLLQESETLRSGLEREIEEVRKDLVATKYRLLDQLDANHADAQEVLSELRELRDNMSTETAYRRNDMRTERWTLVNQLFRVGKQKNQLTQSLQSVKKEQEMVLAKAEAAIEKLGDTEQDEVTTDLFDTLERENLLLKEEKLKLEEHLSILEKAASTSATERQALLHKVRDLRSQLQELTGEDGSGTSDSDDLDMLSQESALGSKNAALYVRKEDVDKELALLRAELSQQTADDSALEMERADWLLEREALDDVITNLRKNLEEQDQVRSLKSEKDSAASEVSGHYVDGDTEKLQALEAEISSLRQEKIDLEDALEELDTQHCQAQEQLIKQRDHLMSQLAEYTSHIQQQQDEIEQLNLLVSQLRESQGAQAGEQAGGPAGEHAETSAGEHAESPAGEHAEGSGEQADDQQQLVLELRCKQAETELAELKSKQNGASSAMEKEVVELREKIHKGGLVINDLHMDKQELEEELKSAREETAAKVAKLKEMRETHLGLEKEKKVLEGKVVEMQDRLSEMEEEVEKWQQVNEEKQVQQLSSKKEHEEVEKLKSQVAVMEKEKLLFSANFNSLSSEQPSSAFSFEDTAFKGILEEEARVRKKIEEDNHVIQKMKDELQKLYESKQRLKQEFHEFCISHESCTPKMAQLEQELKEARDLVESTDRVQSEFEIKWRQESEQFDSMKVRMSSVSEMLEELRNQNEELSSRLSAAEGDKGRLVEQLQSEQIQHRGVVEKLKSGQQQESTQQRLLESQSKVIDSLQAELKAKASLEGMLEAKSLQLDELNKTMAAVRHECDSKLAETIRLGNLCSQKDSEIKELATRLSHHDATFSNSLERLSPAEKHNLDSGARDEEFQVLKDKIAVLERALSEVQNESGSVGGQQEEETDLQETVSHLEEELTACIDKIAELHKDLARANEIIKSQESGIIDLNDKVDVQRRQLQQAEIDADLHKSTIAVLRQASIDKDVNFSEIEGKMDFILNLLTDQQKEYLTSYRPLGPGIPAIEYRQFPAIEFLEETSHEDSVSGETQQQQNMRSSNRSGMNEEKDNLNMNGASIEDDFDSSTSDRDRFCVLEKELEELRYRLKEKDTVVEELQKSSSFLLALLEKEGGSVDKSLSSQISVHKMETELRSLRGEKEQMMDVVAEKSRENSSLKSEVHRLMGVVSAGHAAIGKLQQDNRHLEQRNHSPPRDDGEDDMRREALTNMARLVRDRETEIEALRQKNETLLAVLQESGESQAAAHLAPLLRDKETLTQQITSLASEREQLIACVTQKHSESLAYHAEVQRLTAILTESQTASENMKKDYATLIPAFEDKSQALLSAQNELIRLKQKLADLEVRHGELIQRSSSQDSPTNTSSLENELERLRSQDSDLRTTLSQNDEKIRMLAHRNSTLEENLTAKDTECALLRKQVENSKFQISDLCTEVSNIKTEREQIQQRTSAQNTEFSSLRESYNKILLVTRDKDIETSSLKEQVVTLTSLLNEQQGEHGQVTRLMRENEAAVGSARHLQQERDHFAMVAEQRSQECGVLRNEMAYMKEKELRLAKELERLRAHLLEIEEGFTKDALEAEEREKDLRNKLAAAEEQLMSSSFQVESSSKESRRQLESIQQQLQHVASQRDAAYMQVANIQENCQQYASSLGNLQLVLEHFQKEKDSAIAVETERLQKECKVLKKEVADLQAELQATRSDLAEALDGLEAASRLSEQLDRKEEALAALKEEVQLREQALTTAEEEIHKLNSSTEAKVDKTLMHNMVMTWLLSPENKQMEIVHLMGNILSFSSDDFLKIETARKKGGYLSGFFRRTSTPPGSPARQAQASQTFSQLFVKFLEEESSPPPTPVRLPAEAMAAETQHRHKPAFNPFMAPRHVTQDGRRSSTPSSHLLISPDSPTSTPLFTPFTSMPSSTESAILKNVLENR